MSAPRYGVELPEEEAVKILLEDGWIYHGCVNVYQLYMMYMYNRHIKCVIMSSQFHRI